TVFKSGETISFAASGTIAAFSVTIGATESLDQLNSDLAPNGLTASLDSTNHLVFTTTSDTASQSIGAITVGSGGTATFPTVSSPVADATSQAARAGLVSSYNLVIAQINTTAQDASFNGINLLNGDDLKVTFNETGSSSLTIKGVNFNSTNLGLNKLNGAQFQDNTQIDTVISAADTGLSTLRTQASKFGSNLTTVQTRQDFTKNLINTLQTGADNLVLADSNEEGANMLALQTRQQLSTTALSLSAQSDQAVLRLFQ
ncbi:MAG: flagellin, partial [Terriglobia bacterium]